MIPAVLATGLVVALAGGGLAGPADAGYAECEAFAPFEDSCSVTITPVSMVYVYVAFDAAYSGALDIEIVQNGGPIWNGSCIIVAATLAGGAGTCGGEPGPDWTAGVPATITLRVGVYGAGTYGLRVQY